MAQVIQLPRYVSAVVSELQKRFAGQTDVLRRRDPHGYHYTVAVVSPTLNRLDWKRRHERALQVAYEILDDEQLSRVTILPLRPGDMNGVD